MESGVRGLVGTRHGLAIDPDSLVFCTGVVPAISSMVRKLTTPNENVVIMTPVYNIFFNSILNNGCRVLESPLAYDGEGHYEIDWADFETKLADPQTTLMILCNRIIRSTVFGIVRLWNVSANCAGSIM